MAGEAVYLGVGGDDRTLCNAAAGIIRIGSVGAARRRCGNGVGRGILIYRCNREPGDLSLLEL